ncbi:MAG: arylamine N-acetyltransferase family protein [Thermomicrobiales bacterium]|nr:arylamine N-acetyltransferase [Thermomicrobiales bacterium]
MLDVAAYLDRIAYTGPRDPSLATLRALHLAHLRAAPFENLDIGLGRTIVLDDAALYEKIVVRRRGGFCYELNGLFARLLHVLGFAVTLLSAGVKGGNGQFGPEFDHLTLRVDLDEPWLADVGFGDSFHLPLRLHGRAAQHRDGQAYRLVEDSAYLMLERLRDETWEPQYRFTLQPRALPDFTAMCHYQQTAPESHFTRHSVCTILTAAGRITLSDDRLIITNNGKRAEHMLTSAKERTEALRDHFGIVLA